MTKTIIDLTHGQIQGILRGKAVVVPIFCDKCKKSHTVELWKKDEQ